MISLSRKSLKKLQTLSEAPLGISPRGINQFLVLRTKLNGSSAVLISKILGVSIDTLDTPDTPLTGPLFSVGKIHFRFI